MCLAQHHRDPVPCLALMLNSYLGICPPQWESQLQPFSSPASSLSAFFPFTSVDIAWGCARCQGSWRGSSESCRKSREWGNQMRAGMVTWRAQGLGEKPRKRMNPRLCELLNFQGSCHLSGLYFSSHGLSGPVQPRVLCFCAVSLSQGCNRYLLTSPLVLLLCCFLFYLLSAPLSIYCPPGSRLFPD